MTTVSAMSSLVDETSVNPASPRVPRTPTGPVRRARTRSSSLSAKSGDEDDSEVGTPVKQRSHAMGTAESLGLRRYVKVVVQQTIDVEQRLPQMINKIGTIIETPRHPNTWFRVRFQDGKVLTFRASGLRPLSEMQAEGFHLDVPLEDEIEESHNADDEHDADDELNDFTKGMKVTVKLDDSSKRDKELKPLNGSICKILEVLPSGYKVQAEDNPTITRVVKRKLLRHLVDDVPLTDDDAKKNTNNEDTGSDEDNEDEYDPSDRSEKASSNGASSDMRRKSKKKDQGTFLSDIDTELWIGRQVRINVGKYSGQPAIVQKSGNGWVQLVVEDPSGPKTAKRAYELTLLETMEDIERAPIIKPSDKKDDDEETLQESDKDTQGAEDSTVDSQEDERKGGALSRRRGHYGVSWIERKVQLPSHGGTGVVKKADRETCTVEVDNISKTLKVFRKQDLVLLEEDVMQRSRRTGHHHHHRNVKGLHLPEGAILMGITSTRYSMFQDQVKKHVSRRREKIKYRPNLREWQAILDMQYSQGTDIHDEMSSVMDLFLVPSCTLCGVEKSDVNGACWNKGCPRCPLWDPNAPQLIKHSRLPEIPITDVSLSLDLQATAETNEHIKVLGRIQEEEPPVIKEEVPALTAETTQEESSPPPPAPTVVEDKKRKLDETIKEENAIESPKEPQKKTAKKTPSPAKTSVENSPVLVPTTTALPPSTFRPQYESVFAKKG
ncbi:hypothetical protein THRCLA_10007 [Thraustotheca clavata]|uniref:Uncharacterized protein n=1 Tax=Thraustotheca clavata TaxID=74557 RepID=A0A1V9YSY7_9STRA|nr:hypothetical protein THRCLA_10007 [Thraustotheca clavata]